jgi:hypothetical protein
MVLFLFGIGYITTHFIWSYLTYKNDRLLKFWLFFFSYCILGLPEDSRNPLSITRVYLLFPYPYYKHTHTHTYIYICIFISRMLQQKISDSVIAGNHRMLANIYEWPDDVTFFLSIYLLLISDTKEHLR